MSVLNGCSKHSTIKRNRKLPKMLKMVLNANRCLVLTLLLRSMRKRKQLMTKSKSKITLLKISRLIYWQRRKLLMTLMTKKRTMNSLPCSMVASIWWIEAHWVTKRGRIAWKRSLISAWTWTSSFLKWMSLSNHSMVEHHLCCIHDRKYLSSLYIEICFYRIQDFKKLQTRLALA